MLQGTSPAVPVRISPSTQKNSKILKIGTQKNNTKNETFGCTLNVVICPKDTDGIANSVDPDQTAP